MLCGELSELSVTVEVGWVLTQRIRNDRGGCADPEKAGSRPSLRVFPIMRSRLGLDPYRIRNDRRVAADPGSRVTTQPTCLPHHGRSRLGSLTLCIRNDRGGCPIREKAGSRPSLRVFPIMRRSRRSGSRGTLPENRSSAPIVSRSAIGRRRRPPPADVRTSQARAREHHDRRRPGGIAHAEPATTPAGSIDPLVQRCVPSVASR